MSLHLLPPRPDLTDRRILVAGGTGVVGRRVVAALVADGATVFGLARSPASAERLRRLGATPVGGDALDRGAVELAVSGTRPDTIVHQLTAIPREGFRPRRMAEAFAATNALRRFATRHLVDAAERYGVQRVVAQSIAFGYRAEGPAVLDEDAPLDTGARGAWGEIVRAIAALEDAVLGGRGFVGVVLRYGGLYGPGTAVAPDGFTGRLVLGRRLPVVGSGAGLQSFIHVDDAAGAALAALDAPPGVLNAVDDEPLAAREWIPLLAGALGAPPPRRLPAFAVRALAGDAVVRTMTAQRGASNARIREQLGWRPEHSTFRDGVRTLAAAQLAADGAAQRDVVPVA